MAFFCAIRALSRRRIGWLELCLFLSIAALAAQTLPEVLRAWLERPRAGHQGLSSATLHVGESTEEVRYLVYLPEKYSSQSRWPLLLFLHGSGERGNNSDFHLKYGPPALIDAGRQFPMIIVSPHCAPETNWNSQELLMFLDYLAKTFAVDQDRIYISGYSMGAHGTWELICAAPDRFAAAVSVSGGGKVADANRVVRIPIWAFHGAKDEIVPVGSSEKMIEAVRALGGDARLTVMPDAGHGICESVFSRDDLYDWLLKQHRTGG